jgi:hypothetical protein
VTAPGQKPSLGKVVLVPVNPAMNNGEPVAYASVTKVWSDTTINARVVLDLPGQDDHRTSLTYVEQVPAWDPDGNMRVWSWPPRV